MKHQRVVRVWAASVVVVLALAGCSTAPSEASASDRGPITIIGNSDAAGNFQQVIDAWNEEHPDETVTYLEYAANGSDDARSQLVQNFQAKSDRIDVAIVNNVWTSEFAARQWIDPLDQAAYPIDDLLPSTVRTGEYDGELYAIPFFTDAGMLYYRSDLIPTPPTTFAEMIEIRETVAVEIGCYAGQFAEYDGLTVNFSEAVEAAGGTVIDENGKPDVTSTEAATGLQTLVDGFADGWIPEDAITFQEEESRTAFQDGKILFLRNWPYVYSLATESDIAGKYAVAPLLGIDSPAHSALGGWNLAVSTFSKHKATAADFVAYLVGEDQQRINLEVGSFAPTWASLYDDADLIESCPYLPTLKASLDDAVPLPVSTNWSGISQAISKNAYPALQGTVTVEQALKDMQADIEAALEQE